MNINMTAVTKVFYILLLIVFANAAAAQSGNCRCAKANQQLFDKLTDDNDSAGVYRLINTLRQGGDKNCEVEACNLELDYLFQNRNLKAVFDLVQKQEKLIAGLPCKSEWEIQSYLNYARYYKANEDYENLSRYAFKALENAESRKDDLNRLQALKLIVHLFTRQNQDDNNWKYIKEAEKIITQLPDDFRTDVNYNWLAFEYETKYTQTERPTLLDSAFAFATKAKAVALKYNNYEQLTQTFRLFEAIYYHRGELRKAVASMDSALYYAKK